MTRALDVITFGEAMMLLVADQPGPLEHVEAFHKRTAGAETNVAIGLARLQFKNQSSKLKIVIEMVFACAAVAVSVNQAAADLRGSALGIGFILLGLPVYWWAKRSRKIAAAPS